MHALNLPFSTSFFNNQDKNHISALSVQRHATIAPYAGKLASNTGKLASKAGKLQSQTKVVYFNVQKDGFPFYYYCPSTHIQCWDYNRSITCTNIIVLFNIGPGVEGEREKKEGKSSSLPNTFDVCCSVDLVMVFDAILTSRQMCQKLQCLYENLRSNNFRRMAVLKKI